MRSLAALAVLAATSLLIAAPARAAEQTDSQGSVAARLSFDPVAGSEQLVSDLRLTVSRAGVAVYDQPVRVRGCAESCMLGGGEGPSLNVIDLDGDAEPEVLVDLYTGGAHCCAVTQVLAFNGGAYARRERTWGDPGYRLADLARDGTIEFVTADPRFSALFASYAGSGFPIKILRFAGRFTDVTRSHRSAIRADRARWMRRYRASDFQPQGVLAAWAADMYLLGRRAAALRFVRREVRAGKLRRMPGGAGFPRRLDRTLRRFGY